MGAARQDAPPPAGRRPAAFALRVAATDREVSRVHAWVEQVAAEIGLDPPVVFALQLCLEEAVSNIARHSAAAPALPVDLRLSAEPGRLTVQVEDAGHPFDPTLVAEPSKPESLEAAEIGGLGIHLIRQFSAAQAYERVNGINRLALYFDA